MVHHYMEEQLDTSEPTVTSTLIPHPELEEPTHVKREVIDLTTEDTADFFEPPVVRQMAESFLPPALEDCPPLRELQACCPTPVPTDPMIRDLAISMFAAFILGASVASIIAVYSRHVSKIDA